MEKEIRNFLELVRWKKRLGEIKCQMKCLESSFEDSAFLILMATFILIMYLDPSAAVDFLGFKLRIPLLVSVYAALWGAYAFFITFGYSDDLFPNRICSLFKRIGLLFLTITFIFTIILCVLIVWSLVQF